MTLDKKYDFVLLFDVTDGNPNGDPNAGNQPRMDPETGHGLVTDVALKRKIRNYVTLKYENKAPYEIYVAERAILNNQHERAYDAIGKKSPGTKAIANIDSTLWMCKNFYDVRTFGAVMTTGPNAGQVRGPIQIGFSRSIDPIFPTEHSITRIAVTTKSESENQGGANHTMGTKHTIPYALYKTYGFVNPYFADKTSFSEKDLSLLWEAIENMFEFDRSSSHGQMTFRSLYIFEHNSKLGNAHADKLQSLITVQKISEGPARFISDYKIECNESLIPEGVKLIIKN